MNLALRHTLPNDALAVARIGAAGIEARLVTRYAHGGIVIGGDLLHSNATVGVHRVSDVDMTGWVLIDLGTDHDARALDLFSKIEGAGYDWFSLLAFVVAPATDSHRWYCFELSYLLMTGRVPQERVTPETLILMAMQMGGRLVTPLPDFKDH